MIVGAVDIGGTKIAVGLVDEQGHLLASTQMPTRAKAGVPSAVQRITAALKELQEREGITIGGIGIGSTGPVDPFTLEFGNVDFLPGWQGRGLVDGLEHEFGLPIAMENDADAAALAECVWGNGKGSNVFLYVTISTGIGIGIVIDGSLFRGVSGSHPEIGHHVIAADGPLCSCGAHGCWEILSSGPALARYYASLNPGSDLDARAVCDLAEKGDPLARQAVEHHAYYMAVGLGNLITIFSPDQIALGGGLMKAWHLFEPAVREYIQNVCTLVPARQTRLALASLGPHIVLLGAGKVWFHHFRQ